MLTLEEVWLRAYTASLTGSMARGSSNTEAGNVAFGSAEKAVENFNKRFPETIKE